MADLWETFAPVGVAGIGLAGAQLKGKESAFPQGMNVEQEKGVPDVLFVPTAS